MTEMQRTVLRRFAEQIRRSRRLVSKYEALGSDAAALSEAFAAVVSQGYLMPVLTSRSADRFGGTRFRMTAGAWHMVGHDGPTAGTDEGTAKWYELAKRGK